MDFLKNNAGLGPVFLRWGLALTLLASVRTKFMMTDKVVGMMKKLGLNFLANPTIIQVLGVVLALVSVALILNWQPRAMGVFLSVFFVVSLLAGIFAGKAPFSVGPAIWKDFGLLGAALYLAFSGGSIEPIQAKQKDISH
ncbi:MAG: DoxX family protein [Candidatus Magasanikbacteria bacterium]